jgi:hypothetical protein
MANTYLEKEEPKTPYLQEGNAASQNNSNEDVLTSLESLKADEARLLEQKENLKALLSQLEIKAKEELKKRKRKIERLNSEVSELKQSCERLVKWVNSDPTLECSQTGF